MGDLSWISSEARQLHDIFAMMFYGFITVFLILGVLIEYFRLPLGGVPCFAVLVGRAIIATLLLHAYPEISNTIADFSDAMSAQIGNLNDFHRVLSRMGDKLGELSASWVSVKETVSLIISFISFFALYFSVYVAEAIQLFTWVLSYVFSPILIALFVLPATSSCTNALFRTLFEVASWKVVWSVLATLLWSSALSDINKPGAQINFVTVICYNLILAGSVLLTPWVVHALATTGLAGYTRTVGSIAIGATVISPEKILRKSNSTTAQTLNKVRQTGKGFKSLFNGKSQPQKKGKNL